MAIDAPSIVDFASVEEDSGELRLAIADHLNWSDDPKAHLQMLLDKLNSYLEYVESGQAFESHPSADRSKVVIRLCCLYKPLATTFPALRSLRKQCDDYGIRFEVLVGAESKKINLAPR